MMRSLYSGVAGLKNHQTRMDVTGNNIANVNTVGYKAGRTTFQDMLSQSVKGAAAPTGNIGGVNPLQVGLGMGVASVDNIFTGGSLQNTGKNTDLAIDGDGFFMVSNGLQKYYTRAGNFDFDTEGNYVVPGTGLHVMGWNAVNGVINTGDPEPIKIPLGAAMPPKVTTIVGVNGNLDSSKIAADTKDRLTDKEVYDSEGNAHKAHLDFKKIDDYTWQVEFYVGGTTETYTGYVVFDQKGNYLYDTFSNVVNTKGTATSTVTSTTQTFPANPVEPAFDPATGIDLTYSNITNVIKDASGKTYNYTQGAISPDNDTYTVGTTTYTWNAAESRFDDGAGKIMPNLTVTFNYDIAVTATPTTTCTFTPTNGAAVMTIAPTLTGLTHYGIDTNAVFDKQDGYTAGTLNRATLSVDSSGVIFGRFSNGELMNLGQVALALFTNPGGLTKVGSSLFSESNNSGVARIGVAAQGGYGAVMPSTLEMSNVDLSEEFTTMITTQRGFQANSRIITTSDSMLEELVNLKR